MNTTKSPCIELNSGVRMPALGLGVYRSGDKETAGAVETAIANGYRLIDTAALYGNEEEVGDGIRRAGIQRADVFVTTKLWISDYGYAPALHAFGESLRKLGLDYVDLYLLHWPVPTDFDATVEAYKACEKLLADGLTRAIGVCNHNPEHLEALVNRSDIVPAVNQIELHPWFIQHEVREANARHGIVTQSWSPIGGIYISHPEDPNNVKTLLEEPIVVDLAEKYGKSRAQIVIRWHLQHGLSVIPKSVRPERIAENIDVFDFELTPEDVAAVDAMDTGVRGGLDPDTFGPSFLATESPPS